MSKVIAPPEANEFYKSLSKIHDQTKQLKKVANSLNMPLYVHRLKEVQKVFESVIHEATKNLPNKKTIVFERLNIIIKEHGFNRYFEGNLHTTRIDCNEARHFETNPIEKDEEQYNGCIQTIATLIYKLSGVGISDSVKDIYSANTQESNGNTIQKSISANTQEPVDATIQESIRLINIIKKPNFINKILIPLVIIITLIFGYIYFTNKNNPPITQMETAISLLKQSKYDSAMTLYKTSIENKFEPNNDQIILFENAVRDHYSNLRTPRGNKMYFTFPFAQGMMRIHISSTGKTSYVNRFGVKMGKDFDGGDDFGQDPSQKEYARVFKIRNINRRTKKPFGNYFYIDKLGVCRLSCEIDK